MEQSPMMSVPIAGGRQMEPLNWYFIAAACPVAVAALFFLGGFLPPSLIVLLFIYCLVICPASLVIGIAESIRRRRGPVVHAERKGMALYPSLIQIRVRQYSYAFGITAGPISLIVELALEVPILHAIIHNSLRIPSVGYIFHAVRQQSVALLVYSSRPIHRVLARSFRDSPPHGQRSDTYPVGHAPPH